VTELDEQRLRVDRRNGAVYAVGKHRRRSLNYTFWTDDDVAAFVEHWGPRVRGWFVACTDHGLVTAWEHALAASGRYVFAPLQFMHPGSRVRIAGDGPSQWSTTIVVARPKTRVFQRWGTLPGGYVLPPAHTDRDMVIGGKPLWLMRALVRDYTRPGDLVCDPCAGGATTLLAAAIEGRRAIGAELDPSTHAKAMRRIARGYTPDLFTPGTGAAARGMQPTAATQADLFGDTTKVSAAVRHAREREADRLARDREAYRRDNRCMGCESPIERCGPALWAQQRKCCPDCTHVAPPMAAEHGAETKITCVSDKPSQR
jgi:hypothetical protein